MDGALVSNTGPLVALAVIDRLDLLHCLLDEVIVPEAVHFELLEGAQNKLVLLRIGRHTG
ncbi:MAG TPA: hypothetical protein ENI88_02295 [Desulfobulbus sp.]|nr:hypothetical protein [Desulfobulbus sp.]